MNDRDAPSRSIDAEWTGFGAAASDAAREARRAAEDVRRLAGALSNGLGRAVARLAIDGDRASDVFRDLALNLSRSALSSAISPVRDGLSGAVSGGLRALASGALGAIGFERGGAFSNGAVLTGARAFAKGGLVDRPTLFPMARGLGLMGEAGPEAILPLSRGPDGRLGVRAQGGGQSSPPVQIAIHARDAASFRRSRSQIAAELARAVDRGRRLR
ncbi:MAG: phage tail tape measure protein [Pseudomonadota bacterium]